MRSRFYDCLPNVTSIVYDSADDIVVILAKIDFRVFKFSIRIFDIIHPMSCSQLFMGIVSNHSATIFYFMKRIRQRFVKATRKNSQPKKEANSFSKLLRPHQRRISHFKRLNTISLEAY